MVALFFTLKNISSLLIIGGLLYQHKKLPIREWWLRLLPSMVLLFGLQFVFYLYNKTLLPSIERPIFSLTQALRIDIATVLYYQLPYTVAYFLYVATQRKYLILNYLAIIFFAIATIFIFTTDLGDIVFFGFIKQRATPFTVQLAWSSLYLMRSNLTMYWQLPLAFLGAMTVLAKAYTRPKKSDASGLRPVAKAVSCVAVLLLWCLPSPFFGRPVYLYEPYELTSAYHLFCHWLGQDPPLPRKHYLAQADLLACYNPHKTYAQKDTTTSPKNIVIFLIESGSAEFFDRHNADRPAMPFCDSLRRQSWVFTNAFANATHTITGIDATLGGLPDWINGSMQDILYGKNYTAWNAHLQAQKNYTTAFFYGAKNCQLTMGNRLERYGMHYTDVTALGLPLERGAVTQYDHQFLPAVAAHMTQLRQPFCTALLNIDTHIDFSHIPDNVVLPKGKIESDRAFSYFDYALRLFFAKAQQQPWFANTIFVFLGDHYSRSGQQKAQSAVGKHQIPLWIYAPDGSIAPHETNKPVQQTDIGATALTLAGYAGKTFDFGESLLDTTRQRYAMFLENDFWLLDDSLALQYNEKNEKAVGLFFYKKDNQLVNNVLKNYEKEKNNLTLQVQARLQTINNALIDDKLQ